MKFYATLICFIFIGNVFSQKFDLGKISIKELQEKVHSVDSSAVAAVLFKKAKTTFEYTLNDGFFSVTEFSVKIKIYKKEGLAYANYEIPYYVGYKDLKDDHVAILKAVTYNLVDGKVSETKVTSESKFTEKNNEFWKTKTISFPNVVVGSIIELKYKFQSSNLSILPEFQYQYAIPINYAEYKSEIPEFYIYKGIKTGYVDIKVDDKIVVSNTNFIDKYGFTKTLNYRQINTTYVAENIPALVEEDYVNTIENYFGKIENELQVIRYPEEEPKQIATTWESVAKTVYEDKEFGDEIDKYKYFTTDLKNLVTDADTETEKLSKIFDFVKNRMNWNGKYGYYTRNGVESAYQEKVGNAAEINFILISMLRLSAIKCDPVLISTRDNGLALFPNRSKLNFVIAAANIDGKQILLDATSKLSSTKILPVRDLNSKGRLIYKSGKSEEVDLMPNYSSDDITYLLVEMDQNGKVSGKVREQYSDYKAYQFRNNYLNSNKDSYLENLEKVNNAIQVSNYEIKNEKQLSDPIIENYDIVNTNATDIIGGKLYFSPLLHLLKTQNPFKQEQRFYPVDFSFPTQYKYVINIKIPDGYEIESLPKSSASKIDEDYVSYNYRISATNNQVVLNLTYTVNKSIIPADAYGNLKEFYKLFLEKQNEKIILKKI